MLLPSYTPPPYIRWLLTMLWHILSVLFFFNCNLHSTSKGPSPDMTSEGDDIVFLTKMILIINDTVVFKQPVFGGAGRPWLLHTRWD